MVEFLKYYNTSEEILELYNENISDLTDMKLNPTNYLKIASFQDIRIKLNENYDRYMKCLVSFTNFRNFMFLALLVYEVPLKLHHLIELKFYKNKPISECLEHKLYLIHNTNHNTFTLIFNKKKNKRLVKQIVYNLHSIIVPKILLKYIANYKRYNKEYFFTSANGKPLKKSNISNGLMNYTNKLFNIPVTIHDIRLAYSKTPDYEKFKNIFNF